MSLTTVYDNTEPSDIGDQFPKAYHISKYNGMGTESNQNHKQKHIR